MLSEARKLRVVFETALAEALQYRIESFVWFCWDVFPPTVMLLIWSAAYQGRSEIAGLTFSDMATYYVLVLTFNTLLTIHVEYTIMRLVRDGSLSPLLLRPFPVPLYLLSGELAWKVMRLVFLVPGIGLLMLLFPGAIASGPASIGGWLSFLASAVLAFLIGALFKLLIGAGAFWLTETIGIIHVYEILTYVFGGLVLPLTVLPGPLQAIANVLPFRHQYATPVAFYLGQIDPAGGAALLAEQLVWAVVLGFAFRFVWSAGLRQYESVGG